MEWCLGLQRIGEKEGGNATLARKQGIEEGEHKQWKDEKRVRDAKEKPTIFLGLKGQKKPKG